MAVDVGARIGRYEITALIGEGGMGRVFRARDTTLDRDVALKVLPEVFAADRERLARFEREAKTLAALNHPNIAHVYGLEQGEGGSALVMEYVEGEDFASRCARGPIPLDEALPIARQLAEGIEAAHEQGIVHRDLKPANVKVRSDGTVKVLDFGLAKALESGTAAGMDAAAMANSPTITSPAMTMRGVILGTAAYMSPEQARGKLADKRSDVWAYGCVLYEMLTGARAFEGAEVSDTLAAVLRADPDWTKLRPDTPDAIRRLLRSCLEKDRRERAPDIAVARLAIKEALTAPPPGGPITGPRANRPARYWAELSLASVAVATLTALIVWRTAAPRPVSLAPLKHLALTLPDNAPYAGADRGGIAISPDGMHVVYPAVDSTGRRLLYISNLATADAKPLAGTDDAVDPFFSPDGQWIGFFLFDERVGVQPSALKKIATRGGPTVTICEGVSPYGASWGDDGMITFANAATRGPSARPELFRVSANGGTPQKVEFGGTTGDEQRLSPESLPGGKALLFTVRKGLRGEPHIVVARVGSGQTQTIIDHGAQPRYVPSGHIAYVLGSTLMAVPFDVTTLSVRGGPVPLVDAVATAPTRAPASFAISRAGDLVFARGAAFALAPRALVWVNRRGDEEPIAPPRGYFYPRISPDGGRIALDIREGDSMSSASSNIWIWDIARHNGVKLTTSAGEHQYPAWTPDGKSVAYSSTGDRGTGIYLQPADTTAQPQLLVTMPQASAPYAFSPDGSQLILRDTRNDTVDDLMLLAIKPTGSAPGLTPLIRTRASENNADLSPDGRWIAYQADDSGRFEIYIRPFANPDQFRKIVSDSGGTRPLWARDGRELFYIRGSSPNPVQLMRVGVKASGANLELSAPQKVFEGRFFASTSAGARGRTYDIASDGQRFAMVKEPEISASGASTTRFEVLLNWSDELRRAVPAGGGRQ